MKKAGRNRQLKWSMIKMLAAGWFLPFLLISIMLLFFVSKRMDRQLQNTIMTSADKSIELCELRLKQAMESSKEASYQPMLKEGYARYLQDRDDVKLNRTASNFIIQHYRVNTDFNLTYLYFIHDPENACMTYQDYYDAKAFMDYALEEVMELSRDLDTSIAFVNIHGRMYMVRNIVDSNFRPFAVLTMELNVEDMFGGLRAIWGFHEGDVFIDDVSVFGVYEEDPCLTLIEEKDMEKPHYYHRGEKAYIYMRLDSGWHKTAYAVTLDESVIAGETVVLRYLLIMLAVFMIPLIIVVFVFFHQSVNKPIGALRDAYKEIEKEHYGFHVKTDTRHEEFADLDEAFNSMSDKLQYQFEKIYLEELALRDANIMALQSQINPHFLNNTLEIINWEARMAENYKISAMIESLSEDEKERTENAAGSFLVKNAVSYIEEHCSDKLKLSDVADQVYVSQWHLSKLLNRYLGQNFSEILNGIRIEKAKEMLKDPALRIGDIAERVWFSDMAHFSRVFKKVVGISANEYRNRL